MTVWRWDQGEPFGNDVPNNNPSGAGAFDFSLRFPGQSFDRETNLAYNYFRDYDPGIGRFTRSDPIGLKGGLNTYAYVASKPLGFSDPSRLQLPSQTPPQNPNPISGPHPGNTRPQDAVGDQLADELVKALTGLGG